MVTKLAQGAEAIVYTDYSEVTKHRFEKIYRHPALDKSLRGFRTRREAKILEKLKASKFPAPMLIMMDDKDMKIKMEHIPGELAKNVIDDLEGKNDIRGCRKLCKKIGEMIANLHNLGIVHQDLTTSNMIVHRDTNKVYLIDFGLSFFSDKLEDLAVDLHLFRHALESRHHKMWAECFKTAISTYKSKAKKAEQTLKRLEIVEKRGRNKTKQGC